MRYILPFLLVLAAPASAQSVDWKSLGHPLDNDTTSMRDRRVYSNPDTMSKGASLDQAFLSQDKVATWVSDHAGQIMTLDGAQYDAQVYKNRLLFTPTGYADYVIYLKNTNLSPFLKNNQYKIVAFVDGVPNIISQQVTSINNADTYTWEVTANLVLSYLDYRNQTPTGLFKEKNADNRTMVQAKIELVRIASQDSNNLIAINHLSIGPVPAPTESLDRAPADE